MKLFIFSVLFALSCSKTETTEIQSAKSETPTTSTDASPSQAERASRGVASPKLKSLLQAHWEWTLQTYPLYASEKGDSRYADKLPDASFEAGEKATDSLKRFLEQANNISSEELSESDAQTLALFIHQAKTGLALNVCKNDEWRISPFSSLLYTIHKIPSVEKIQVVEDLRNLDSRIKSIPTLVKSYRDNLSRGLKNGLVANKETVRRTIETFKNETDKPWPKSTLATKLSTKLSKSSMDLAVRNEFWDGNFEKSLKAAHAALKSHTEFLENEIWPNARIKNETLTGLPLGASCYQASIYYHLGEQTAPATLHELGINELKRINAEMTSLGTTLFGLKNLSDITKTLRTDPSLYFETKEAVLASAEDALKRAKEALDDSFGVKPKAECVVKSIPDFRAPFSTIAYYDLPNANGKPGTYFVNTHKPETRPKFEAEVLAFHESIPGHHLQIAIAQELESMPAFRKEIGNTAFVEGWALYTEQLADEMNLYSSDLNRMGKLSYDAWRASRLVVDTGLHHFGWTRQKAEEFMMDHTALTPSNITNEVDRYIAGPGQALAYKMGQLEILRLRKKAKETLGPNFKLSEFHDVVLSKGAVTLPVLGENVGRWLDAKSASAESMNKAQ